MSRKSEHLQSLIALYPFRGFALSSPEPGRWVWQREGGDANMRIEITDTPSGIIMWGDALDAPVGLRDKHAGWLMSQRHGLGYFNSKVAGPRERYDTEYLQADVDDLRDEGERADDDLAAELASVIDGLPGLPETYDALIDALEAGASADALCDIHELNLGMGPTDDVIVAYAAHCAIAAWMSERGAAMEAT